MSSISRRPKGVDLPSLNEVSGDPAKTSTSAQAEHDRLISEAKKDADNLRSEQTTALKNDQTRLSCELTELGKQEVFAIARKTLGDLATVSLEERIGEVFTRRIREMQGKPKDDMGTAIRTSSEPALVRSVFAMPEEQRTTICNAVNETFSIDARLRFETSGNAVCGIELSANGLTIGWNIAEYLTALGEKVDTLIETQGASTATAEPERTPVGVK